MKNSTDYRIQLMLDGCRKQMRLSQLQLYEQFYSYGMGICLRYAQNKEEAQEMVNDGFLRVFKKIHLFHKDKPFKPWLRRIMIHTAIDYYRKHRKDRPIPLDFHEEWNASVANAAPQNLAFEELIAYLQHLPPAYRMVFNLFAVEEMTHPEIAKYLGISVGTSKSNLAKARMKLRAMLQAPEGLVTKREGNESR